MEKAKKNLEETLEEVSKQCEATIKKFKYKDKKLKCLEKKLDEAIEMMEQVQEEACAIFDWETKED